MKLIFAMEACSPLLLASQRPAASWVAARCGQQGIAFDCYFYGESSSQQPDWVPAGCGDLPRGEETACPVTEGLEQWPEQPVPSHILNQTLVQPRVENPASQVLLVAGKGIRSRDDVDVIRTFAHERGYQFGVTRPVAMSGWGRLHEIIGVSGSICAPKVCITLGVSGSAAFYAGITHSDFIASVNSSPEAPIHKLSDVSIVDDYANVWQRLFALLKERNAQCAR